jgi:hypothetical protein
MYLQSPSWPSYFRVRSRHGCICSLHLLNVPILVGKNLWMSKPRRSRGLKMRTKFNPGRRTATHTKLRAPTFFQGSFGVVLAQFSLGIQIQPSGSSDRHNFRLLILSGSFDCHDFWRYTRRRMAIFVSINCGADDMACV